MRNLGWFLVAFFVAGCTSNVKQMSAKELIKSREIRKVSEAEILQAGMIFGNQIRDEMRVIVDSTSFDTLACGELLPRMFEVLVATHHVDIRMISADAKQLSVLETGLMEAYQYNFENGIALDPSIQKSTPKQVLYVCPIMNESLTNLCQKEGQVQVWMIDLSIKDIINRL